MKHQIECIDFLPYQKNTLCGFADILIRELRLIIHDVTLHQKGSSRWAALPAKPLLRDGVVVTDAAGKAQYSAVLEFEGRETRDAFSSAVWRAFVHFAGEEVKS